MNDDLHIIQVVFVFDGLECQFHAKTVIKNFGLHVYQFIHINYYQGT